MPVIQYEWDPDKARLNLVKHGVDFDAATRVFDDPNRIEFYDRRERYGEDRWKTVGRVGPAVLAVVYTVRQAETGEALRLISARKASRHEKAQYGQS